MEWNDTFSPGGFRNNDGTPICEVDRSHLSALSVLLCSGGKERYVRELLKLQHVRGCPLSSINLTGGKKKRNHAPLWEAKKIAAEELEPAWVKKRESFSLALLDVFSVQTKQHSGKV